MFGFSFLYPLFLVGAAAVAIPILLHLFRRKTDAVVDFPAVQLLQTAPVEQHRRRRLREWILLALRVTALALLALAFARPYMPTVSAVIPAPVTVVALDSSLSLSAPGQFERAREIAREAVNDAPASHTVALVTFADSATLVVPPTSNRSLVLAGIDEAQPTAGGTRFRTALARSAEALASGEGQIIVVTDLQQTGWDAGDEGGVPQGIDVHVREVAAPAGNVAVTAARREGDAIIAGVHNFGGSLVRAPVSVWVGDNELGRQSVEIGPQAAADVRFVAPPPTQGGAEVRVEDAAGYQYDNSRYVVLAPPSAVPVFIVTAEPPAASNAGLYVERALAVADEGRAFAPRVIDGRAFSALADAEFGRPGAIFLLGTSTLDRTGRQRVAAFLGAGGRVLLTLGPDVDVATLADTVGTPVMFGADVAEPRARTVTLVAADTRHPIFRPFVNPTGALGDVYVERYRRLNDEAGRTVLARFSGAGDALVEQVVERGRLLVFASDLDNRWNRFPLNPAFVPWVIETARYLAQGRDERESFTVPDVPSGIGVAPGLYQMGPRTVAVNPDVRESNPARTTLDEFVSGITRLNPVAATRAAAAARDQEERQRLWQVGLLVMLLALAGEGLIGRRAVGGGGTFEVPQSEKGVGYASGDAK
ncbi:MAG TPA: BatA domain-containing protein [Vicinamibacterales bacterium]|nr:BatA domain-containing protein [Vicinamibacterales bacterium]